MELTKMNILITLILIISVIFIIKTIFKIFKKIYLSGRKIVHKRKDLFFTEDQLRNGIKFQIKPDNNVYICLIIFKDGHEEVVGYYKEYPKELKEKFESNQKTLLNK